MKNFSKKIIIYILTLEARIMLKVYRPKVVAITGSIGKTGTKDVVAEVLGIKYSIRKSPKSFNSEIGVPLTILGLNNAWNNGFKWLLNVLLGFIKLFSFKYADMVVLEIGADKPGDISFVSKWLRTDVVIITAVPDTPVHMEFYPTLNDVLKEKSQLINSLKEDGILITGHDSNLNDMREKFNGKQYVVDYDNAGILYKDGKVIGMNFTIKNKNIRRLGILGKHQGYSIAFAMKVAEVFGIDIEDVIQVIENMDYTPGRMRILEGKNNSTIIDDSYNSSPEALKAALITLGKLEISGRKIAVLGDMRELGDASNKEHRRAGIQVAHIVDELYTIGEFADELADAAIQEGLNEEVVHVYDTDQVVNAGNTISNNIKNGDVVLVKSSQGNLRLERIVKMLLKNPEQAPELLVRQEEEWLKR